MNFKKYRPQQASVFLSSLLILFMLCGAVAAQSDEFQITASYDPAAAPNTYVAFGLETNANVVYYEWEFGDGDSSLAASPTHLYRSVGVFEVRLKLMTSSGANYQLVEPDLVVISNQIFADDFDQPLTTDDWEGESRPDFNRKPYGAGYAMGFWILQGPDENQQMPNTGVEIGDDSGSSPPGNGECSSLFCPGTQKGLFRFQAEIRPAGLPEGMEFTLFKLQPSNASIRARWTFGQLQVQTVLGNSASPWKALSQSSSIMNPVTSIQGRFEVEFEVGSGLGGVGGADVFRVDWIPANGALTSESWENLAAGTLGWKTLDIGALDASETSSALGPVGQIWIDNFERLAFSLGGNSL